MNDPKPSELYGKRTPDARTAALLAEADRGWERRQQRQPEPQPDADTVPWYHRFHTWTRWELAEAEVKSVFRPLTGDVHVQRRRCTRCNKIQVQAINFS